MASNMATTTTTTAPPSNAPFFKLPKELRNAIYEYVIGDEPLPLATFILDGETAYSTGSYNADHLSFNFRSIATAAPNGIISYEPFRYFLRLQALNQQIRGETEGMFPVMYCELKLCSHELGRGGVEVPFDLVEWCVKHAITSFLSATQLAPWRDGVTESMIDSDASVAGEVQSGEDATMENVNEDEDAVTQPEEPPEHEESEHDGSIGDEPEEDGTGESEERGEESGSSNDLASSEDEGGPVSVDHGEFKIEYRSGIYEVSFFRSMQAGEANM
jgi:hypothetical protein